MQGRRWPLQTFSVLLGLVGLGALALTVLMNIDLGQSLALSDFGRVLQGASAAIVDLSVVALATASGLLLRKKRHTFSLCIGAVASIFAFYSFLGVLGFGAKERIEKSRIETKQQQAIKDAVAEAVKEAGKQRTQYMTWLQGSSTAAPGVNSRAQYLDQATKVAMAPVEVKVPEIKVVSADAQAVVLSEFLDGVLDKDQVQRGLIGFLALLLVVAKLVCPFVSQAIWPEKAAANIAKEKGVDQAPAPAVVEAKIEPEPKVEVAPAAVEPMGDNVAKLTKRSSEGDADFVRAFFLAETIPARAGRIQASTVYEWFADYCRHQGRPVMPQQAFGRACSELKIPRDNGRVIVYRGFQKKPVEVRVAA